MKLRFSIRDLGWLTLLPVIVLFWYLDPHALVSRNWFTVETIQASDALPVATFYLLM
jgi:hypothetical protein